MQISQQDERDRADGGRTEDSVIEPVHALEGQDWKKEECQTPQQTGQILTFAHILTQVPEAVEGVEHKRRGESDLTGVLNGVGDTHNKLDDVRSVAGGRCDEVGGHESCWAGNSGD